MIRIVFRDVKYVRFGDVFGMLLLVAVVCQIAVFLFFLLSAMGNIISMVYLLIRSDVSFFYYSLLER